MLIRATYAGVAAIYHQLNRVDIYVFILPTIDVIIFYGLAMAFLRQLGRRYNVAGLSRIVGH